MPRHEDVWREARKWVGTPYLHQHGILGMGCDCWHVPRRVGEALGLLKITAEQWAPFAAYGRQPSPRLVLGAMEAFFLPIPTGTQEPGDVPLIAWRPQLPMHVAILGDYRGRLTLIHALETKGKVVEHGFTAEWPSLVHSWWRFPGLES